VTETQHPRVLLLHNRYRTVGGEERSVALQAAAFAHAGVPHALLERRSADAGQARAAVALLRGGEGADQVRRAVQALGADVVHAHNTLPLIGPRGLQAAREAGAKVVLHLHNVRLFCATGFGERDGGPCTRCRGRNTLPGLRLNCRRSVPEAVVYATALSAHQPAVLDAVDRFVTPSAFAAERVSALGLPADRVEPLAHYLPAEAFASSSQADRGEYLLVASRLSPEKGIGDAIAVADSVGAPLRIVGDGPVAGELREQAAAARVPVELLGRVEPARVRELLAGAAAVLMPSRYHEFSPYSALEARAPAGACRWATWTPSPPAWRRSGTTPAPARSRAPSCWNEPGRGTRRSGTWSR
jgi:glycosyltransferase involved in cell wall biosynthesis